ncbi:MAG: ATPase, T2SS/T4P/T4SS family, partial [Fimbriimonadaceae bacterium]
MLTGEIFVEEGLISEEQLKLAVEKHRELGGMEPIARVLVNMGLSQERDRVRCLGKVWGVPFIEGNDLHPTPELLALISPQSAKRFKAIPVEKHDGRLVVAMVNPLDVFVIDELRLVTGLEIEPKIAVEEDIQNALATLYKVEVNVSDALQGVMKDFDGDIEVAGKEEEEYSEDEMRRLGEDAPIIRLANLIINQAITDKASDIHIEPMRDGVKVRVRIDGVMLETMKVPRKVLAPLTSRIK